MRLKPGHPHLGIIERPRLTRVISGASARLIILFGPAGYGKTTLARQWVGSVEGPVAWHSCRRGSADVAEIALGVTGALEAVTDLDLTGVRERIKASPNPQREAETLGEVLATHLESLPNGSWLALDDYHYATREGPAEEFVGALLGESVLSTIITTRVRPRWATARRVLYGELVEVSADQLSMTEDEARAVFEALGRAASESELSLAGGWPAIIGLLARNPDLHKVARSGLNDFLAEEVCRGLDGNLRDVLEMLAAMPAISPAALGGIVGKRLAKRVADEGVRRGIITETVDEELDVHEVLRSFFEARTVSEPRSQHLSSLVRKASDELIATRAWDHAFELATRFSDEPVSDLLLDQGLRSALDEGRTVGVRHWLELVRVRHPSLSQLRTAEAELALRDGLYLQAETVAIGTAGAEGLGAEHRVWAYLIAARSAHLGGRENVALQYYRAARRGATSASDERIAAWGELAVASDLELTEAPDLLTELRESQLTTPDDQLRLSCRSLIMGNRFGTLSGIDDARVVSQLVDLVSDPYLRTAFRNVYSYICAITGDYDEAEATLDALEVDAQRLRLSFVLPYCALARAIVAIGVREFEDAAVLLSRARDDARRTGDRFVVASAGAILARGLIAKGKFDEAASAASPDGSGVIRSMKAELMATKAVALACAGAASDAQRLAVEAAELSQAVEIPVLAAVVRCIIASAANEPAAASYALELADLARTTRYVDGLIVGYRGYPELGRLIALHSHHRRWLRDLMRVSRDDDILHVAGLGALGGANLSLSPREAEVFGLMRQGLSNREIAANLFISEATVKVHAHHIYDKLGVRTRTEAVLKAPITT